MPTLATVHRFRTAIVVGIIVATIGRAIDLWWHATHDEFETGGDQVRAHTVAWIGAAILLVAAFVAIRRGIRTPGFAVVLVSAVFYAVVAVWHFWLHTQGQDPDLPHVLLFVSQLGLYVGSALVTAGLFIPRCNDRFALSG